MANYFEKWKKKKFFEKITDILFILLIVAFLIPGPRKSILTAVNRLKAMVIQPKLKQNKLGKLSYSDFQNWYLKDSKGQMHSFSEYKGKVIFINFWATWCGPCMGEMPEIQKFYNKFKNNPQVQFLIVTTDDMPAIKKFLNKHKNYNFPVFQMQSQEPDLLMSNSIPTSFLIDKEGNIVMKTKSAANWSGKKMENFVKQLIKQ